MRQSENVVSSVFVLPCKHIMQPGLSTNHLGCVLLGDLMATNNNIANDVCWRLDPLL